MEKSRVRIQIPPGPPRFNNVVNFPARAMVDQFIVAVLAWLHIFFAVGWLGGGIMFGFVIGPALSRLSPPASGEFFKKVVPRILRFFQIVPGLTILFGLLLLYAYTDGNLSVVSLGNSWGLKITLGMTIGLIALLNVELLAVPYFHKAMRIVGQAPSAGSQGPPAELLATLRKARISATVTVFLLIIALMFMVGSAFPF